MERVASRQTGDALWPSRLFWATLGLYNGAGTHVAGATGKDSHLHGDVGTLRSQDHLSEVCLFLC